MCKPVLGDRVLVTTIEEAGEVTVDFGDGTYYVRVDSGDVVVCGAPAVVMEEPEARLLSGDE